MSNLSPPSKPTNTSINLIIASNERREYNALVNAGSEYYHDGLPVELYSKILSAVCDVVEEWNNKHK